MLGFLNADVIERHFLESFIPLAILAIIIMIIIFFKKRLKHYPKVQSFIPISMGSILTLVFFSYYIWFFVLFGFNHHTIPLKITTLCTILAVFLCFYKNKTCYHFLIICGIFYGTVNLLTLEFPFTYHNTLYYLFIGNNLLIMMIPLYFLIETRQIPKFIDFIMVLVVLKLILFIIVFFNLIHETSHMCLVIVNNPCQRLGIIGEWPKNVIIYQILILIILFIWYGILTVINQLFFENKQDKI